MAATLKRAVADDRTIRKMAPATVVPLTRTCSECAEQKPLSRFLPASHGSGGRLAKCIDCIREASERDRLAREARFAAAVERAGADPKATKMCKACRQEKALDQFSKHRLSRDGHRHQCKPCARQSLETKRESTEAERVAKKARAAQPFRKIANRVAVADWTRRNPAAVHARAELNRAVRRGLVKKAAHCEAAGCSRSSGLQGHHHDYREPLSVAWLCARHHRRLHVGGRIALAEHLPPHFGTAPEDKK